jgi:small GTP-binding protein
MKVIQKKICLLGDFSVGKTSLIRQFIETRFDENYLSTIGVHMSRKRLDRGDHHLDFLIWDLAGGEEFKGVGKNYLRGASGGLIVCDLTRRDTLASLAYYAEELRLLNPQCALVFAANKVDLKTERTVSDDMLQAAVAQFADNCLLTSAKTGEHVNLAFSTLADQIER